MGEDNKAVADIEELNDEEVVEEEPQIIDAEELEAKTMQDPEVVNELEEELERIKEEKAEVYDRMLRIQAEFENFKRRSEKEKLTERKYKSQDLANELLPALDNFERALQAEETEDAASILKGVEMVYKQIKEAFKSQKIEEIETVGKPFDPNVHHAVMQEETEGVDSNIVVEELQKGYILNDRVIRAAMVKVNK